MIIKKELLKKLYLNYFAFKLNLNEFRSPLNINEKTILLIYVYKIFCKNTDDILQNERSAALQIYFILIETEEIEEKLFSNIRFWLGDYPWIMNNLSDEKMNEEELRFFSNKIFNQGYKHNNFIFFEKQNELLKCFGDNNQKYFLVSAPTSFGKTKIIVDNINVNSCIIVPTIALQNEIGNLLRNQERFFNKIITKSNFNYSKNFLYVFTQEKLLNFLSFNKKNNIKFDTLVVDEAHQMLSNTTRSFLLEGLIKKFMKVTC